MFGSMKKVTCPFCLMECKVRVPSRSGRFAAQACPRCSSLIPEESLYSELLPIAVVGPSRSGKTHFLTVMAHLMLEEVVWSSYWTASRVMRKVARKSGDDGGGRFSDDEFLNFEECLYPQSGAGLILRQTERRNASRPPLSLVMHISFNKPSGVYGREPYGRRNVLLSFTDTAGEDLTRTGWGDVVKKYPVLSGNRAKAMIALVDPAEFSAVRDEIRTSQHLAGKYADVGIELKVLATMESVLAIPQIRKTMREVPLAVCMAKTDALVSLGKIDAQNPLAGPVDALYGLSGEEGRINLSAINDLSDVSEAFFDTLNPGGTIASSASLFKYRSFFSVDALGLAIKSVETVDGQRIIKSMPRPRRVLDPLMWILWQHGYVGGAGG